MAQRTLQIACDRFRNEILPEDARLIEATTNLDDVKLAIGQVERQLAARQLLRDMDRITPFVDAIGRYSKALEVAANGTPYLPWLWAPIKLVLLAVQDHTHALDKILSAYGQIGLQMPRFSRFAEAFPNDRSFQHLLGFLFEDVLEFHRRAYAMIRKSGWKMLFRSAWGGFENRFGSLLESIARVSVQIDREAIAIDIIQAVDQRKRDADAAAERETQWHTQQLCIILNWLEASDTDQETKFEILRDRCHEGTLGWVTNSPKLRSWLRGHGKPVLWLHGKPGSGKSVLAAKLISFLSADTARKVAFFFCDFNTPVHAASTGAFRALTAQILRLSPDTAPFVYEEYIAHGKKPTNDTLTKLLPRLISNIKDLRLLVDGLDEIPTSEHRKLITDLLRVVKEAPGCKILLISQDIPSISVHLSKHTRLSMAEEGDNTEKDLAVVVSGFLRDLDSQHDGALGKTVLDGLQSDILKKAKGMFLWVHLVLDILVNAACLEDLHLQINSLPATLAEAFLEEYESPIINRLESQASIAYACVCQLIQGLDLLVPTSTSLPPVEIALGLLSLWPYSIEHWVEHLLDCFEVEHDVMPASVLTLIQRVSILCQRLMNSEIREPQTGNACPANTAKDQRFMNLMKKLDPSVSNLIGELCSINSWTNDDQSPLARPMQVYQSAIESLMQEISIDGISTETMLAFKELYGPIAFSCNIRGCQHAISGFPSKKKLEDHQALHFRELRCDEKDCHYNDIGFQSQRSLREHRKRHHGTDRSDQLPKRLRRVSNALPEVGHQYLSDENDWDYITNPHVPRMLAVVPHHFIPAAFAVRCTNFSPDGKRIAVCGNKTASIFDVHTGLVLREFPHSTEEASMHVLSVCFSPDGNYLATGSVDGLVRTWDIGSGVHKVLSSHRQAIYAVCYVPDGKTLVSTCDEDEEVKFWNTQTGSAIFSLDLRDSPMCVSVSPDCKYVAVGCFDNNCYIFHMESKSLLTVLRDHGVYAVAFSPDNRHIATAGLDKTIKIWRLGHSPEPIRTLEGHEDFATSVTFTANSRWVISGSMDRTTRIWDMQTGEYQVILKGHKNPVIYVAVSPDGNYIATAGGDKKTIIWSCREI
ncbi:nacht domain-containing protein [Fusarium sporotrichioides]|uniref:Nacht domain-containing protein n=1 Tax=Fusarium sporotrichioides TaxID=5514 RepID=A0A395RR69_FUSSP|nr:nacht domain-containing protein [Fusarium sporotrichioides]